MSTGCKSSLVNQITSCLFSFVVEFANWITWGEQTSSTKNTKSSLLVPSLHSGTAASSVVREDSLDLQS